MTPEETKIINHALNIARLKQSSALIDKEGKLKHVLESDVSTYVDRLQNSLEIAAKMELLNRSAIARTSIDLETNERAKTNDTI